jgi:acyl carrier protein
MDELTKRVTEIVSEAQQIPIEQIGPETPFADLGIDSLGGLSIIGELESEYGVEIPNEEAMMISNVQDAVVSLRRLLPAQED